MVNIGTRVAPVNIAFSSSRNAALIELKMLHYTTLSLKLHHCTLSELKTLVFTLSDVLACVSIHCADKKQHSNPNFLTKSINNTLQTCVDIANEYLQAYNTGAGVKNYLFLVCINVNEQVIQCFCMHLFSLTNFFENKISIFTIALGQNSIRERQRKGTVGGRECERKGAEVVGSARVRQGGSRRNRK